MPNKELSAPMKRQFAEALKKRLLTSPLDKITVTELAEDCGVNRQTFYYHFEDIYDLTCKCLKNEAESVIDFDEEPFDWKKSVRALIKYIDENNALCVAVLNSMGHRMLKKVFADDIERLIRKVMSAYRKEAPPAVTDEMLEFNIIFYSMAVSGLLESWILKEINISSEKLIYYIESIVIKNAAPSEDCPGNTFKGAIS